MVKVYGVNQSYLKIEELQTYYPGDAKFSEDLFVDKAEEQGLVWSLKGFQEQFNDGMILTDNLIIYIDINEE